MVKVLIADDHILLAESLRLMLQHDGEIEVVALAADGEKALELCASLLPEVVLIDIKMLEKSDGLKATRRIKERFPSIKVAILTTFENSENIIEAFLGGADGYILKDVRPEALVLAIKCLHRGFHVMQSSVSKILQKEFIGLLEKRWETKSECLKPEDLEIIRLIGDGKNNKEIAEALNYSEGTIKNKISRILETLHLKDRTQLVVYALKNNLI